MVLPVGALTGLKGSLPENRAAQRNLQSVGSPASAIPGAAGAAAAPTPLMIQASPPAQEPASPFPKFSENPIAALGLIISNAADGFRGKQLPTDILRQEALAAEELEIRKASAVFDGIVKIQSILKTTPADKREVIATQFTEAFKNVAPGFDFSVFVWEDFNADDFAQAAPNLADLSDASKRMVMSRIRLLGGGADSAAEVLADKDYLESVFAFEDDFNRPQIIANIRGVQQILQANSIGPEQMPQMTMAEFESLNSQIPENVGFSKSEIGTIRRQVDLQDALNIIPTTILEKAKTAEAEEAGKISAKEGEPKTDFAKLRDDFEAGKITEKEFEDRKARLITITGRTEQDLEAEANKTEARTTGRFRAEAGRKARAAAARISSFADLLDDFQRAGPGAAGFRGGVASFGAGLLSQLNRGLGEGFSQFVAGVDQDQLQNIRSKARSVIGSSITEFSGEESGRFSEPERALAEKALQLLEGEASFEQIRAALGVGVQLAVLAEERELREAGAPIRLDLDKQDGQREMVSELIGFGLTPAEAADTVFEARRLRKLLIQAGAKVGE